MSLPKMDVKHRNSSGHTALDRAREKQRAGVIQVLLACGAEE